MIGLLLVIQCLGREFTPDQLCRFARRADRLSAEYYTDSLLCKGKRYHVNHGGRDNTLLMGRVYELEEANRSLRSQLAKAKK
jgi:hypothetical protein